MDTTEQERRKYEETWKLDRYRETSPAERDMAHFLQHVKPEPGQSLIDFGCGTGRAALHLHQAHGLQVTLVDIASNCLDTPVAAALGNRFVKACLWELPSTLTDADYGLSCDVMEHLPEKRISKALAGMRRHVRKAAYFQIALFPSTLNGETLHLTVKPGEWWLEQVSHHFAITHSEQERNRHVRIVAAPR